MGHIEDYEAFLAELRKVWEHVYRLLVPGGRLVCVVGDVCVSLPRVRQAFGVSAPCRHLCDVSADWF